MSEQNVQKPRLKRFVQGYYQPKNPHKYKGNVNKIVYRSSWELKAHNFFDNNPNVLEWSSEEVVIPYLKPTDGRVHRYFPDYWVKYCNKRGEIIEEIIEVKPRSQTQRPRGRNAKTRIYEQLTHAVNIAKWAAASEWCKQNGMVFRIITENSLFK